MNALIFMGLAGAGKTAMTKSFGDWLSKHYSLAVSYINLDPGVKWLPYTPDLDVRAILTVENIMITEQLGPNAAIVRAMEEIEKGKLDLMFETLRTCEICILDTPGLFELFALRPIGNRLVKRLFHMKPVGVYLMDASQLGNINDVISHLMLGFIAGLKLEIPVVTAVNKVDTLSAGERKNLKRMLFNPSKFMSCITTSCRSVGVETDFLGQVIRAMEEVSTTTRIVFVSATKGYGFYDLFGIINEAQCVCGDLS